MKAIITRVAILFYDDSTTTQEEFKEYLTKEGYPCYENNDGYIVYSNSNDNMRWYALMSACEHYHVEIVESQY